MSEIFGAGDGSNGNRLDRTISVRTLIAIITLVGGSWWWSTQVYADLKATNREHTQEIESLKADLARVENNQAQLARSVKDDLRDINMKLDRLTDRLIPPPDMSAWTRK